MNLIQAAPNAWSSAAERSTWAPLLTLLGLAVVLAGCVSAPPQPPASTVRLVRLAAPTDAPPPLAIESTVPEAPAAPPTESRFAFSVGDEFDLRVPDAPQFDQTLKVRPDGKVSLALLGTLQAQGRTPEDLQDELQARFERLSGGAGVRDYLLQPGDEIELKFPYHTQLNELLRLRPDGKIQVQMIGTVRAEGLSPEELQQQLKQRYARYLKVPELSVMVRSVTTQNVRVAGGTGRAGLAHLRPTVIARAFQPSQVFVGGEVARPGVLAFRPGLSLLQALVESGGQLPTGDARQLVVLRRGSGDTVQVLHPELPETYARAPDRDVVLQPYDVVLLPKSDAATLADRLNMYVFNLFPPLKNSSFGFAYSLGGKATTTTIAK